MSLRLRLILLLLLVNAGLLGIAQVTSFQLQQRWLTENAGLFQRRVWNEVLQDAYRDYARTDPELAAATVQRLLVPAVRDKLRVYFRDTWISSTGQPAASVDVNPMGAHRRDPATFPYDEIRAGIREAMAQRTTGETDVRARVYLDGRGSATVSTGDNFYSPASIYPVAGR